MKAIGGIIWPCHSLIVQPLKAPRDYKGALTTGLLHITPNFIPAISHMLLTIGTGCKLTQHAVSFLSACLVQLTSTRNAVPT